MINNLAAFYDLPETDNVIANRIEVTPTPIVDLNKYEIGEGCKIIEKTLKQVFQPTEQIIGVIREIFGMARAHLKNAYSSELDYRERCYVNDLRSDDPWHATALLGLGGVGKSQLIKALTRLLNSNGARIELEGMPSYPIEPIWVMTMRSGVGLSTLLSPFTKAGVKGDGMQISAAKNAYTNGVGLNVLDESQFITSTQEGHAKAGKTLMLLTCLGPPLLYCTNYSMINKLEKRPNQERDRLLSNILVLMPEARKSRAFHDKFEAQLKIFGNAVSSDLAVSAAEYSEAMHNYVYGIDRKSAVLLEFAWRVAREEGSEILTFRHVEKAYRSDKFTSHRTEVEILKQQAFEKKMIREDLWCNYAPPLLDNVHYIKSFDEERQKRASIALTRSTFSKEDRDAYDALSEKLPVENDKKAKVVKLSKPDKTLSALQAAGFAVMDQVSPSSS